MDDRLHIATGHSARSKTWKNTEVTWPELVEKLRQPQRTGETEKQYARANAEDRAKIKDVGGYVGGYLAGGRRKPDAVTLRSLITLDLDFAEADTLDTVRAAIPYAYVLHSTHSHLPGSPRYRFILPLDKPINAAQYPPIARRLAERVGIDLFDETGYQPYRLMFWPSCSADAVYVFDEQDGPAVPTDEILATYVDWQDVSAWPTSKAFAEGLKSGMAKLADPLTKPGVIGAFCRTYDVHEAIEKFLSDHYKPVENGTGDGDPRYTYIHGSTAGGLVVYEDGKFAYSHHGTDPISGTCVNAYDLVRAHLFGDLDSDGGNRRSMAALDAMLYEDEEVAKTIAAEQLAAVQAKFSGTEFTGPKPAPIKPKASTPEAVAASYFDDNESDDDEPVPAAVAPTDWMAKLDRNKSGYLSSATNLRIIFANDPNLRDTMKRNLFDGFPYVFPGIPWRDIDEPERLRSVDLAGLRAYLEILYGITSVGKVDDAVSLHMERNTYHPVRDYLNAAHKAWDKQPRIESLLPMYLGAEASAYTSEAMKVWMTAAVARIFKPGVKFDLVLTLVGEQGTGKSTFLSALGGAFFSDTFGTFNGKEAFESLQGAWIIEMAELSGMARSSIEAAKHFITKCADQFRPAYGRTVEIYKRQCVFGATTNEDEFLRDSTGNRRFVPVKVDFDAALYDPFDLADSPDLVAQLWGEAVAQYRAGGKLYLTGQAHNEHMAAQERHSATDSRMGTLLRYLDMEVPESWDDLPIPERKMYVETYGMDDLPEGARRRDVITSMEVWVEAFKGSPETLDKVKAREINTLLQQVQGWKATGKSQYFGRYGKQRYYART